MTIRLVIAEDNALLRDGITLVLREHGLHVVATAADADQLIAAVEQHHPDVAIVDVRMPRPTPTKASGRRCTCEPNERTSDCSSSRSGSS